MLAFTPDVEAALQWFEMTHELVVEQGRAQWMRTALPHAGGVGDQDTRLLATIEYLRAVHNQLAGEEMDRIARKRAIDTWREKRKNGRH